MILSTGHHPDRFSPSMKSLTLVGRASDLAFKEFPSGATLASFTLTVKPRDPAEPQLVVRCEGYGMKIAEQFNLMDEDCLVGIIGILTHRKLGPNFVFSIDHLEYLGKPLAQEVTP
jgi:hypothetical protein